MVSDLRLMSVWKNLATNPSPFILYTYCIDVLFIIIMKGFAKPSSIYLIDIQYNTHVI